MTIRSKISLREKRLIKPNFGVFFDAVEKVLFEADPMRINVGFNTDEYEPEVRTIIPRLKSSCTVQKIQQIVYEEFCFWFGKESFRNKNEFLHIARNIWILWNKHNGRKLCRGRFQAKRNSLAIIKKREECLATTKLFSSFFEPALSKMAGKG